MTNDRGRERHDDDDDDAPGIGIDAVAAAATNDDDSIDRGVVADVLSEVNGFIDAMDEDDDDEGNAGVSNNPSSLSFRYEYGDHHHHRDDDDPGRNIDHRGEEESFVVASLSSPRDTTGLRRHRTESEEDDDGGKLCDERRAARGDDGGKLPSSHALELAGASEDSHVGTVRSHLDAEGAIDDEDNDVNVDWTRNNTNAARSDVAATLEGPIGGSANNNGGGGGGNGDDDGGATARRWHPRPRRLEKRTQPRRRDASGSVFDGTTSIPPPSELGRANEMATDRASEQRGGELGGPSVRRGATRKRVSLLLKVNNPRRRRGSFASRDGVVGGGAQRREEDRHPDEDDGRHGPILFPSADADELGVGDAIDGDEEAARGEVILANPRAFFDSAQDGSGGRVTVETARLVAEVSRISSEDWARRYRFDDVIWPRETSPPNGHGLGRDESDRDAISALASAAVEDVVVAADEGRGGNDTAIFVAGGTASGKTRLAFGSLVAGIVSSATRGRTKGHDVEEEDRGGDNDDDDGDLGLLGKIVDGILLSSARQKRTCSVSILEIADDDVLRDVLLSGEGLDENGRTGALRVRQHSDGRGAVATNLTEAIVPTMERLRRLLGESFRSKALRRAWATEGGHGHFVATIAVTRAGPGAERGGTIQLVDLASPDRPFDGPRSSNGVVSVRKSLSALRGVLGGIARTDRSSFAATASPTPYRESTLTKLLRRTLEAGGAAGESPDRCRCRAAVIGMVAPDVESYHQTLGTLDFMTRLTAGPGDTASSPFENALPSRSNSGDHSRNDSQRSKDDSLSSYRKSSADNPPALRSITSDPRQRLASLLRAAPPAGEDDPSKNFSVRNNGRVVECTPKNNGDHRSDNGADRCGNLRDNHVAESTPKHNGDRRSDDHYDDVFDQLDVLMSVDDDDDSLDRNSYGEEIIQALTPYKAARSKERLDGINSSVESSEALGLTPSPFRERGGDCRKVELSSASGGVFVDSGDGDGVARAGRRELERKQAEDKQRLRDLFLGVGGNDDNGGGDASKDPLRQSLFPRSPVPSPSHSQIEFRRRDSEADGSGGDDRNATAASRLGDENFRLEDYRNMDLAPNQTTDSNDVAGQGHDRRKGGSTTNSLEGLPVRAAERADDNDVRSSKTDDFALRRRPRWRERKEWHDRIGPRDERRGDEGGASGSNGNPADAPPRADNAARENVRNDETNGFAHAKRGHDGGEDRARLREGHRGVERGDAQPSGRRVDVIQSPHADVEFPRRSNDSASSSTLGTTESLHRSERRASPRRRPLIDSAGDRRRGEEIAPPSAPRLDRDSIEHSPEGPPAPYEARIDEADDVIHEAEKFVRSRGERNQGKTDRSRRGLPTCHENGIGEADDDVCGEGAGNFTLRQRERWRQEDPPRLRRDLRRAERPFDATTTPPPLLQTEIEFRRRLKPGECDSWDTTPSTLANDGNDEKESHRRSPTTQSSFQMSERTEPHHFANAARSNRTNGKETVQAPEPNPKFHSYGAEPRRKASNDRISKGCSPQEPLVGIFDENRVGNASDIMFGRQGHFRRAGKSGNIEDGNRNISSSVLGNSNGSGKSHGNHDARLFHPTIEESNSRQVESTSNRSLDLSGERVGENPRIHAKDEGRSLGPDRSGENGNAKVDDAVFVRRSTAAAPLTMLLSRDSMDNSEPLVSSKGHASYFDDRPIDNVSSPPMLSAVDAPPKSPTFTMLESFTQEIDALVNNLTCPPRATKKAGRIVPMANVPEAPSSPSTDDDRSRDLQNGHDDSASIEQSVDPRINVLEDELASLRASLNSLKEEKSVSETFLRKMQLVMNENDDPEILSDVPSSWPQTYKAFEDAIRERQSLLVSLQTQLELSQAESVELSRELQHAESRTTELSQFVDDMEKDLVNAREAIDSQEKATSSEIERLKERLKDLSTKNATSSSFFNQLDALIDIGHGEASVHDESQCKIRLDTIKSLQYRLQEGMEKLEVSLAREGQAKSVVCELRSKVHKLENQIRQLQESSVRMESKRLETEKIAEEAIFANEGRTNEITDLQGKLSTAQNGHRALLASHNASLEDNKELSIELEKTRSFVEERDNEISRLKTSFSNCQKEKVQVEHQFASIRTKTVDVMRQRIEGLKVDYTKRLEDFKASYSLEHESEGMTRLKIDLSNKEAENSNLQKRIEEIEKSTSSEHQNSEERLHKMREELRMASNEASRQTEEKKEMQNELDHLRSLMDIAEESVGELNHLKEENKKLNDTIKFQNANDSRDTHNQFANNDKEEDYFMHERISALMRENEQNNISMRTLQSENVTLKSSIEECTSTIHLMHSEMNDLKAIASDGVSRLRAREKTLLQNQQRDRDAIMEMEMKLENANSLIRSLRLEGAGMFSNPHVPPSSMSRLQTPQYDRGAYQPGSELPSRQISYRATPSTVSFNERKVAAQLSTEKELRFKAEEICAGVLANSKSALEERDSEIGKLKSQLFNLTRGR